MTSHLFYHMVFHHFLFSIIHSNIYFYSFHKILSCLQGHISHRLNFDNIHMCVCFYFRCYFYRNYYFHFRYHFHRIDLIYEHSFHILINYYYFFLFYSNSNLNFYIYLYFSIGLFFHCYIYFDNCRSRIEMMKKNDILGFVLYM